MSTPEALLFAGLVFCLFAVVLALVIYAVMRGAHPNVRLAERLGAVLHERHQQAKKHPAPAPDSTPNVSRRDERDES